MPVSRRILFSTDDDPGDHNQSNQNAESSFAAKNARHLVGTCRKLAYLSSYALEVFQNIGILLEDTDSRIKVLSNKYQKISSRVNEVKVTIKNSEIVPDLNVSFMRTKYLPNREQVTPPLFVKTTNYPSILTQYKLSRPNPQLWRIENILNVDAYSNYSFPGYFFQEWLRTELITQEKIRKEIKKEKALKKKIRQERKKKRDEMENLARNRDKKLLSVKRNSMRLSDTIQRKKSIAKLEVEKSNEDAQPIQEVETPQVNNQTPEPVSPQQTNKTTKHPATALAAVFSFLTRDHPNTTPPPSNAGKSKPVAAPTTNKNTLSALFGNSGQEKSHETREEQLIAPEEEEEPEERILAISKRFDNAADLNESKLNEESQQTQSSNRIDNISKELLVANQKTADSNKPAPESSKQDKKIKTISTKPKKETSTSALLKSLRALELQEEERNPDEAVAMLMRASNNPFNKEKSVRRAPVNSIAQNLQITTETAGTSSSAQEMNDTFQMPTTTKKKKDAVNPALAAKFLHKNKKPEEKASTPTAVQTTVRSIVKDTTQSSGNSADELSARKSAATDDEHSSSVTTSIARKRTSVVYSQTFMNSKNLASKEPSESIMETLKSDLLGVNVRESTKQHRPFQATDSVDELVGEEDFKLEVVAEEDFPEDDPQDDDEPDSPPPVDGDEGDLNDAVEDIDEPEQEIPDEQRDAEDADDEEVEEDDYFPSAEQDDLDRKSFGTVQSAVESVANKSVRSSTIGRQHLLEKSDDDLSVASSRSSQSRSKRSVSSQSIARRTISTVSSARPQSAAPPPPPPPSKPADPRMNLLDSIKMGAVTLRSAAQNPPPVKIPPNVKQNEAVAAILANRAKIAGSDTESDSSESDYTDDDYG